MNQESFNVIFDDPGLKNGVRVPLLRKGKTRSRAYCRRVARQLVFEGASQADVVRVSDGEVVRSYTSENSPVAKRRADGRCPLRFGND